MIQLDQAETAINTVLADQLFDVPQGIPRQLVFYKGEMAAKRKGSEDDDVSYCHLQPGAFRFTRQGMVQQVRAGFVLYSGGTPAQGLEMVADTAKKLSKLAGQTYSPCSLVGEITGNFENIEHPNYWLEIDLQLTTINEAQL